MKTRKWLVAIPIGLIIIAALIFVWYSLSVNLLDLDAEKVATIKVQNGNTGEILEITNQKEISYLINEWYNTKLKRQEISLGRMGYGFRITFLDANGNNLNGLNDFCINSNEVIRKDPFFYSLQSGNLNYDYIQSLFDKN